MWVMAPGLSSQWPQGCSISQVFGIFSTAPGSLVFHSPDPGPLDSLYETQNNFTQSEIQENDASATRNPIIFAYPLNQADRLAGRYCSLTGMWAPGRFIVYSDGKPFITIFARIPESQRYSSRTWPREFGG